MAYDPKDTLYKLRDTPVGLPDTGCYDTRDAFWQEFPARLAEVRLGRGKAPRLAGTHLAGAKAQIGMAVRALEVYQAPTGPAAGVRARPLPA